MSDVNKVGGGVLYVESYDTIRDRRLNESYIPVFFVTTFTYTTFGKVYRKVAGVKYTHSAMGFDSSLENLYSFNAGTDRGVGGVSSESISAYLNENPESEIYVGMVILTPKEYNKLRKKLNEILKNKDNTHYNFKNVFNIVINHPSSDKNDFSMICSEFVDYIFKFAGIDLTGKDSSIATPTDLKESKNERVKFIYEGLAKDYKSQRTRNIMRNCIRSINAGKHMNLIKGDLVIESVKEKDIMSDSIKDELREEDTSVGTMLPVSPLTGSEEDKKNKYSEMYNSMMPHIFDKEKAEKGEKQDPAPTHISDEAVMHLMEPDEKDKQYRFISESVKKEIDEIDHNIGQMMLESGMDDIEKMVRLKGDEREDCIMITEEGDKETSGRDIDEDMKPIISKLNGKGYKTKYSCSGHPSSKDKDDIYKDGVKNGKLYSTARIVFAEIYDFPNIPKYWSKKILDDDKTALYVKAPTFTVLKGLPEAQYKNWKVRYMDNLKKWADELPNKKDLKDDSSSDVAIKEDGEDSLEIVMNELKIDLL